MFVAVWRETICIRMGRTRSAIGLLNRANRSINHVPLHKLHRGCVLAGNIFMPPCRLYQFGLAVERASCACCTSVRRARTDVVAMTMTDDADDARGDDGDADDTRKCVGLFTNRWQCCGCGDAAKPFRIFELTQCVFSFLFTADYIGLKAHTHTRNTHATLHFG